MSIGDGRGELESRHVQGERKGERDAVDVDNGNVWAALVAAERDVVELQASIRRSADRRDMLALALDVRASAWDQRSAMNYLRWFPSDIGTVVPSLFLLAMGGKWEGLARNVLSLGRRDEVGPEVSRLAIDYLPTTDPQDYLQLASLLAALDAGEALGELLADARRSDVPDVRNAGVSIEDRYRHLISSGRNIW